MTSEPLGSGDLDALLAALAAGRELVVVAPNGTVNTGLVTGDQRQIVSTVAAGAPAAKPMRQGPVRAKDLAETRRRFVPPPGFEDGLAALDNGVAVVVGAPGTGRRTHALNLLAHGRPEPVLIQVDGAADLSRWVPPTRGAHGYLVMEPPDPFALRSWDLTRLEASLAEAGARLLIVLTDAPGLTNALEDRLGTPVLLHRPPDPRSVFAAHLADICPDEATRARKLGNLGRTGLAALLPAELPPRQAALAAEAVARHKDADCAEVLAALARAEAPALIARAQHDPVLQAHLLALSVYGGLDLRVVVERAEDLLRLTAPTDDPGRERPLGTPGPHGNSVRRQAGATPQQPSPDTLRGLGAHRARQAGADAMDTVSFFWPAVGDAVWECLCREHTDLLPRLHTWLAGTGPGIDRIDRAGRALAAMAEMTGGRTLEHLPHVASTPGPSAVDVAARCLGAAFRDPEAAAHADRLLEEWSVADHMPLRAAVGRACRSDRG